jgi:hypothetical protein
MSPVSYPEWVFSLVADAAADSDHNVKHHVIYGQADQKVKKFPPNARRLA